MCLGSFGHLLSGLSLQFGVCAPQLRLARSFWPPSRIYKNFLLDMRFMTRQITFQTYTYQDEHSAPFSWRTRSTQDLSMEPEEDVNNDNLETLAASPSKILNNRGINLARYSRGNPSFAKPVQIPTVPKCIPVKSAMDNANRNSCVVSNVRPEQINNFVYQSPEQKLVMDFGEINLNEDGTAPTNVPPPSPPVVADCSRTSSPDSTRSSRSILTKMRRTFSSARARRKSSELSSATDASSLASLESNGEYYYAKRLSLQQHQPARPSSALSNTNSLRMVRKPTVAPPPPPPSKTSTLPKMLDSKPPKPPTRTTPVKRQQSERKEQMAIIGDGSGNKSNVEHVTGDEKKEEPKETNEELLGEFKIDLTTTSSQVRINGGNFKGSLLIGRLYNYRIFPRRASTF